MLGTKLLDKIVGRRHAASTSALRPLLIAPPHQQQAQAKDVSTRRV